MSVDGGAGGGGGGGSGGRPAASVYILPARRPSVHCALRLYLHRADSVERGRRLYLHRADSASCYHVVDQPHLKKCSRKLFDSILC